MRTKKVGLTGRYGARYGKSVKRKILDVEKGKRKERVCPHCLKSGLKRMASGIWFCKKCGLKLAGKAYKVK